MKNKIEIKKFLGMEVRVVNNEHIVLKDMFGALGRVKADGGWNDEKKKLINFLNDIDKNDHYESLEVVVKRGQIEEVQCLRLETVPIVLTQFRPTKAKGEEALNKWCKFMKFVDDLLVTLEVHNFIITDKEFQKDKMDILTEAGGSAMVSNQQVNTIMAKLIGVYDQGIKRLKKEELKIYQGQTTVDLLTVREFVLDKFVNAYEFTGSHKTAMEMTEKLARKKYKL